MYVWSSEGIRTENYFIGFFKKTQFRLHICTYVHKYILIRHHTLSKYIWFLQVDICKKLGHFISEISDFIS